MIVLRHLSFVHAASDVRLVGRWWDSWWEESGRGGGDGSGMGVKGSGLLYYCGMDGEDGDGDGDG